MTDQDSQHVPHPTLADICRELVEIRRMVQVIMARLNPPPAPSQEGNIIDAPSQENRSKKGDVNFPPGPDRNLGQTKETRQYIEHTVMPKLKSLGVQSKQEAERMLYGFCLVDKFEVLTRAQAEAFHIHLQESTEDPPGLWRLKTRQAVDG